MRLTISQIAQRIGAEVIGDTSAHITAVGPVEDSGPETITFVTGDKHKTLLAKSRAGAVIVRTAIDGLKIPQLVVKDVNKALIEALKLFAPELKAPAPGIDPAAKIAADAKIAPNVSIGAFVAVESGVEIGQGSVISSGCKIGENTRIGSNCRLDCNVVVYHNCVIGNNVIIQANTTIGSTGFGYAFIDGRHQLIPHNGGVIIEDFVEIGANSCVDRAKFGNTKIGAGTKIDNLVQIGHNAVIGKCCLMAGQAGIAGSTRLGDGVVMGGQAGIIDNLQVGAGTMIGATSVLFKSFESGLELFGTPATEKMEAIRAFQLGRRLPKMAEQLKQLAARIDRIESSKDDKK